MHAAHIFAYVQPGDHAHIRMMDGAEYCGEVLAADESGLVIRPLASVYAQSRVAIPTGAIIAVIVSNDPETRAKHTRRQEQEADLIDQPSPATQETDETDETDETTDASPPLEAALERFALPSLASLPASRPDAALGAGDTFIDETDLDPRTGKPRIYQRALSLDEALAGEPDLADVLAVFDAAADSVDPDPTQTLDDAQAYMHGETPHLSEDPSAPTQEGVEQEFYRRFSRATPLEQQVYEVFARWRSRRWALRPVD